MRCFLVSNMRSEETNSVLSPGRASGDARLRNIERREWRLWSTAVVVTLVLTLGLVSFLLPHGRAGHVGLDPTQIIGIVRGLICLVALFDIYVIYQHLQIYRIRHQLMEREELFRLISENAADMIALVDANGKRLYNSPAYFKILGYTQEELKDTSAFEQVHPEDQKRVEEAAKETQLGGVGRRIEYRMRHKNGSWLVLESTASTIVDAAGQVEKLVIVNRDITDRKRLEEQYRQAQKMEAVGRLSGGIAHDFNNLLGVIIGFAEILQSNVGDSFLLTDSVEEILKAGKRAGSLTRQLLAFSRQQVLEPKLLDLNNTLSEIEKMLKRIIGEDIELTTILDPDLGRIKADEGQIEQVVLNLVVNARDAMPSGGRLVIETKNVEIDEEFASRYSYPVKLGEYLLFTVTDSGVGMDAEVRSHMFEPFFTTKEKGKGTGLGLATVYGIVKQSGGYIDVSSELGCGATFKIYLPRVYEDIEAETPRPEQKAGPQVSTTLLVVEDEGALLKSTCSLLRSMGYKVLGATSGAEALRTSEEHKGEIDLVLADVVMPGMSGPELGTFIAAQRPSTRIVYMSGYTGQSIGRRETFSPNTLFIMKPFTRDDLDRKIREALHGESLSVSVQ